MINKIFIFLKNHFKTILQVIFGLFILYYLIFFLTPTVKISVDQKQKLDSLSVMIKQINDDNKNLEDKISDFNREVVEIDQNIGNIKNQKIIIKEIYHEKINSVDKFTISEIDSFFANRYK